jgi:DNA-binding response OmpR family regulator
MKNDMHFVSVRKEKEEGYILDLEEQIPKLQKPSASFPYSPSSTHKAPIVAATSIMLVDDEPDIIFTYKTILCNAGYNVDVFTDPIEALMRFTNADPNTYNLVVMDIRMPNLNGLQLYYRLKTKNPDIKILFVSALDSAQEMISILPGISLDDVLRKPVDNNQFLSKVKIALEYVKND